MFIYLDQTILTFAPKNFPACFVFRTDQIKVLDVHARYILNKNPSYIRRLSVFPYIHALPVYYRSAYTIILYTHPHATGLQLTGNKSHRRCNLVAAPAALGFLNVYSPPYLRRTRDEYENCISLAGAKSNANRARGWRVNARSKHVKRNVRIIAQGVFFNRIRARVQASWRAWSSVF